MPQTEDGKNITDSLTEEGRIVLDSLLLENGHIVSWVLRGSLSAISSVSGTVRRTRSLKGIVSATSSVSGTCSVTRKLSGTVAAVSSLFGILYIPLTGSISALSAPRQHIMRRRGCICYSQVRLFEVIPGTLSVGWSLKGPIAATSAISGTASVAWSLKGNVSATSSVQAVASMRRSLKGAISAASSVTGSIMAVTYLAGSLNTVSSPRIHYARRRACHLYAQLRRLSIIPASLHRQRGLAGSVSAIASVQGILSHAAPERGFYYAKLGSTILTGIEKDSFRITEELNKIPSFEFEIANCSDNRTTIAGGITDVFRIYRLKNGVTTLMFTGLLNADAIEYLSLERIRIIGYASYIDLNWRFHQHLNTEDVETVDTFFDCGTGYTNYTTQANNDTVNDVLLTFGGMNHALYIGMSETFFGAQIKYSTKGVQAGSTTVVVEYSKTGTWATLDVLDETRAFTKAVGTYYFVIAHKPSDWTKQTINGVKRFWIRFRITAGSYTTPPKLDRIKMMNVDPYRVYYFEEAADNIMDDVLLGTGYSMDAIDSCPAEDISIVAEYETKLRFIAGIANALTWDDSGDKKAYQWWIDTSKKVHFKQKRGDTLGDITAELTILNNVEDYFNLSNRLHFLGNYDGLNQLRAVIENTSSQDTHEIRELAVHEERHNNYIPLKEAAEKAMAYTKAPLQKIAATVSTKYWLDNAFEVGDTVTLHKDTWNVDSAAFQIVRADIGPRVTNIDMGVSQEHLDGLKAGLQRQLDISGIRMHGSTSIFQIGPVNENYQRVDAGTVYPSRLKIEIPSTARYIHKVLLSWKIEKYRSSVEGGGESAGHDHTGAAGSGGAFTPDVLDGGAHTPTELGKAHTHDLDGTLKIPHASNIRWFPVATASYQSAVQALNHHHTNPSTGNASQVHTHTLPSYTGAYDNDDEWVADDLTTGTACTSGYCITGINSVAVPSTTHYHNLGGSTNANSVSHTHTQGDTGDTNPSAYIDLIEHNVVTAISDYVISIPSQNDDPAHIHTINPVADHPHTGVAEPAHSDHTIVTEAAADIDLTYGVYEEVAGTLLELIINGETVGSSYSGDQTDIVITGYLTTGSNTVLLQPISSEVGKKGSASFIGTAHVFIEAKKW